MGGADMGALETILLVEDDLPIRQLMAMTLEGVGYRVLQARDGREALNRFDQTVDLLLVDMRLPRFGGQELMNRLRERRRTLKIVSFSAYPPNAPTDPRIVFIQKPFSREQLLTTVRAVLDGE